MSPATQPQHRPCPAGVLRGSLSTLQGLHRGPRTRRSAESNCTKFYLSLRWGCHFMQLSRGYRRIHLSLQQFLLVLNAPGILTTKQARSEKMAPVETAVFLSHGDKRGPAPEPDMHHPCTAAT